MRKEKILAPEAQLGVATPLSADTTVFRVILAISFCHLLNDMMQILLPSIYPNLASGLGLTLGRRRHHHGLSGYGVAASASGGPAGGQAACAVCASRWNDLLARRTGGYIDGAKLRGGAGRVISARHGLLDLSSGIFACRAHGGRQTPRHGTVAISGGWNIGSAIGPIAAALIVVRFGQSSLALFGLLALLSFAVLWNVAVWYRDHGLARLEENRKSLERVTLPQNAAKRSVAILLVLIFSKYVYLTSLTSYFTFYLIQHFGVSIRVAQVHLSVFLAAVALGTFLGGPVGDRIGRKYVIWVSILGVLPFTLLLPHVNLFWTGVLSVIIGMVLASAFPAIVVYGQELVPGKVGMISGLFFGFAFGVAGLGAAVLGRVADAYGIYTVYRICAFLPTIGLLAGFLPDLRQRGHADALSTAD